MNSVEVISIYEQVATITDQMVVAAEHADWELLAQLEAMLPVGFLRWGLWVWERQVWALQGFADLLEAAHGGPPSMHTTS